MGDHLTSTLLKFSVDEGFDAMSLDYGWGPKSRFEEKFAVWFVRRLPG